MLYCEKGYNSPPKGVHLCYNLFSHTVLDNDLQKHLNVLVKDNQYYYRDHLLALDACRPLRRI